MGQKARWLVLGGVLATPASCVDDDASPNLDDAATTSDPADTATPGSKPSSPAPSTGAQATGLTLGPASSSTGTDSAWTESSDSSSGGGDSCEPDDCAAGCGGCPMGSACEASEDCESRTCDGGSCLGPAEGCDLADVSGTPNPNGWGDSYSADGRCYCDSTFDHAIGDVEVETPVGTRTVREICDAIGPGPGIDGNPVYNDIQCGHGPPNDAGDEDWCPGRVDQGTEGCCTAGPRWDLSVLEASGA